MNLIRRKSNSITMPINRLIIALTLCAWSAFTQGQAFMPSQQQIEQFKRLPPAQQRQMAESFGVDLDALGFGGGMGSQPTFGDSVDSRPEPTDGFEDDTGLEDFALDFALSDAAGSGEDADALPLFGRELFSSSRRLFRPATDIPIPSDYILGPGDTLVVQLYGKENASHSLVVNREGQIQFPQIGPVTLAGISFSQAQEVIADIVSEQMIGVRASVTMGALRTIRVFVLGEVEKPGSFTVGSLSTMTNALFESRGITDVGSLRNVQLKRNGEVVTTLDIYDLLLQGDTSKDARLMPGDVIFVPPIGRTAGITGAVKRPATYEISGRASAQELIRLAGGLRNTAHLPVSYLTRLDEQGEKSLINIDLSRPAGMQQALEDGDILTIASSLEFVNNQITLSGHVKREGERSWRQGLKFSDIVPSAFQLLPNPDIEIALIERYSTATRHLEVLIFSPREAWDAPGSAADPTLNGNDVVRIFNYEDPRTEQLTDTVAQLEAQARFNERQKIVTVSGSVRFPGTYPMTRNMTTRQLIQLAGGLTESAFGISGEVTRYDIDENSQRVVEHINVDLIETPIGLFPGDSLQVKQVPLWKKKETVELLGEVMFPGIYTILPGETLIDVLTRAGGLTPHAYPLGAVFSREELRDLEQQRLTELKSKLQSDLASATVTDAPGRSTLNPAEAEMLMNNLEAVEPQGRMVIDLPTIMRKPENHDFQLEDGDRITIPRYKPSVTVLGEVQHPTSHFYDDALTAFEYIERSGGYKKQADKSRIYIVKANGRVVQPEHSAWFRTTRDSIQPGDTIVVPLDTDTVNKLSLWTEVTQIIYQTALGVAALNSL